jgi:hypothetical protein
MKKKPKQESKPVPKQIDDLEEFQAAYGEQWQAITQMPAFRAGLQLLNVRSLDQITSLSNEDIDKYGVLILSSLIGLLKHENDIFNLHNEQTFKFPMGEDEVVYVSPEEEAAHQQLREKFAEQTRKQRHGN